MEKPPCWKFRVITTKITGVQIFRSFTVIVFADLPTYIVTVTTYKSRPKDGEKQEKETRLPKGETQSWEKATERKKCNKYKF